ncbi:AAA family ATPase [Streptomyces sp. NPDC101234]|uniref:AAA family ATPase n=1 Tax=Streptomyces sp. NPDC101234 TaxID=3366138 RepID=UPI003809C202
MSHPTRSPSRCSRSPPRCRSSYGACGPSRCSRSSSSRPARRWPPVWARPSSSPSPTPCTWSRRHAAALLGDPPLLVLDEPVNGLDTEGIRRLRELLRSMAAEGRTVLISSHLMTETALVADHLVVISRGRLLADTGTADFIERHGRSYVRVRTPEPVALGRELERHDATVTRVAGGGLDVVGIPAADIGRSAAAGGFPLDELSTHTGSLEEAYLGVIGAEGSDTRV